MIGTFTPTVLARYGVHTPPATTTAPASNATGSGVDAGDSAGGLADVGDLHAERGLGSCSPCLFDVVLRALFGLALRIDRTPHRPEERTGGRRYDLAGLGRVQQLDFGKSGVMGLLDQTLEDGQLLLLGLKVEVPAGHHLEVTVLGRVGPQFERLLSEGELAAVAALGSERALRAA